MVDIKTLAPGDRIHLVSEWNDGCGSVGYCKEMEQYLGKVVTVANVFHSFGELLVELVEDRGRWVWNSWMIAEIVEEDDNEFEVSADDYNAVLNG